MVNPEITWRSDQKIIVWDACLSFLSIFMQVERNRDFEMRYQDLRRETRFAQAKSAIYRNCFSMKSITWTVFSRWTASRIYAACAREKSLRRGTARRVRTQ